ncbi:LysM peptidoglycan-binding domain-containing protein [Lactobacillus terrae]|uniref:LysM peptidoglycan-binding domain-containing protein n=1 Tax=Lactobacillus terrae TaxID=2269374 RepID=UPI000C1B7462|nr:LysM domain-containing protein [Lactobacillus terrae]
MANNDNNNFFGGSKIPKTTSGIDGSVSPEDLVKYNLGSAKNEQNIPANGNTVVGQNNDSAFNDVPSFNDTDEAKADSAPENDFTRPMMTSAVDPVPSPDEVKADANVDEQKPWENSFDSDTDEEGHISRAVSNEKKRGNKTLIATLVILLIVCMFTPVVIKALNSNNNSNLDSTQTAKSQDSSSNKSKDTSSTSNKKKSTPSKKKSKAKETTDNSIDTSSNTDSTSATDTTGSEAASTNNSSQSNSSANAGTSSSSSTATDTSSSFYTVKAGDNWYRIAYNHGMTTAQLQALNGGATTLTPGTTIRVK